MTATHTRTTWAWRMAVLFVLAAALSGCARFRHHRPGVELKLAYNVWVEDRNEMFFINYMAGRMLPAGTPVSRVALRGNICRFIANGRWHHVYYRPKFHPGVGIHTATSRMFTDKSFEEMTQDFTNDEVRMIRAGEVGIGMSKDAVLVSWGYPPEHKTRSLRESEWRYWRNRWRTVLVTFGGDDRVIDVKY